VGHPAGDFTHLFVRTFQLAAADDLEGVRELWLNAGMIMNSTSAEELARIISLDVTPYVQPEFRFSSDWITERAGDWNDPGGSLQDAGKLSFPPSLLLEHRAITGMLALITSIDATVDFQTVIDEAVADESNF
jgi:hypothetical protein